MSRPIETDGLSTNTVETEQPRESIKKSVIRQNTVSDSRRVIVGQDLKGRRKSLAEEL